MKTTDPAYRRLRTHVRRGDVSGVRKALEALPADQAAQVGLRAAGWALTDAQPAVLEEILRPRYGVDVNAYLRHCEPSLVHVLGHLASEWAQSNSPKRLTLEALLGCLAQARGGLRNYRSLEHPLTHAAQADDVRWAQALIAAGADPDGEYRWTHRGCGGHSWPPLCNAHSLEMVEVLLAAGANAAAAPPGTSLGGMGVLAQRWKKVSELPALFEVWLRHGGQLDAPMDRDFGPSISVPEWAFVEDPNALAQEEARNHIGSRENQIARRARHHAIQVALVAVGLDLNGRSADGTPWREWVSRHGAPELRKKAALDLTTPLAHARTGRPRM